MGKIIMEKRFCKHCKRVTLFLMNFPVNFADKNNNKTKKICNECHEEL